MPTGDFGSKRLRLNGAVTLNSKPKPLNPKPLDRKYPQKLEESKPKPCHDGKTSPRRWVRTEGGLGSFFPSPGNDIPQLKDDTPTCCARHQIGL